MLRLEFMGYHRGGADDFLQGIEDVR
jgi:hypothetical protein